jgi:hypothetical protein
MTEQDLAVAGCIEHVIFILRGQRVMLDADLATLYGVETKELNRAVKRNAVRFPIDFMFQLTDEESERLRCQIGTSKHDEFVDSENRFPLLSRRGGRRYLPYAFTEQGVAMLSSVLKSERAALVNIEIMRAFVKLREMLRTDTGLARKLEALERRYDAQFRVVFEAIRGLTEPPIKPKRGIGFRREES